MNKTQIKKSKIAWEILYNILNYLKFRVILSDELNYVPIKNGRANLYIPGIRLKDLQQLGTSKFSVKEFQIDFIRNIVYEIGHYLIVPNQRKRRKNFGIPNNYKNIDKYDIEEMKACVIEKEIMRRLGIKDRKPSTEIREQHSRYSYINLHGFSLSKWWKSEGLKLVDDLFERINKK